MGVKIKISRNMPQIMAKIQAGEKAAVIAATEAVVKYGNIYVRVDQGTLEDSSLTASIPAEGKAIWDTPYAKRVYYTGEPSRDKNENASLRWADEGVRVFKKEIDQEAQNAFTKGIGEA